MKIGGVEVKRRVWAGTSGALAVIALWVWWSQATLAEARAAQSPPEAFVRLTGRGDAAVERMLRERAAYQDATPLFFPTTTNFRAGEKQGGQGTAEVFRDFGEVLQFQGTVPHYGTEAVTPPATAIELMEKGSEAPFAGFGQVDSDVSPRESRWAKFEVKSLVDGRLVLSFDIGISGSPSGEFDESEFVVKVGPSGLAGALLLTRSSGRVDVDAFVRDYLVKTARIGARLPPGSYRVSVGP